MKDQRARPQMTRISKMKRFLFVHTHTNKVLRIQACSKKGAIELIALSSTDKRFEYMTKKDYKYFLSLID